MGARGDLFIVSGPSGSGKTTVVHHLLETVPDLLFSVSCTTRAPRPGERDGREYRFVTREQFETMLASDEFLEHAIVFDQFYGTPRRNLEKAKKQGKDLILDIDVQGARQIKEKLSDAVAILLVPPSASELERRLRERAQDEPDTIRRRLNRARTEIEHYRDYDYLVINHDLQETCSRVVDIIQSERGAREVGNRADAMRRGATQEQISAILETFGAQTP